MNDAYLVVVGCPPWHFGPFDGYDAALEWANDNRGQVWPLWEPEESDAMSGRKARTQAELLSPARDNST